MEPIPSQVRNNYWQKNQQAHLQRALVIKNAANLCYPSNVCLPNIFLREMYIVLWLTNDPDLIIKAEWQYTAGDQWWRWYRPQSVHSIVQCHYRRFGLPTGRPTSRSEAWGEVVMNEKGSTGKEMEPCQYCYFTRSTFKLLQSGWGNGTNTIQRPKVNRHQQIIRVWEFTIHPSFAATQSLAKTTMFHIPRAVPIRTFPNTKWLLWGSKKVDGGNCIPKDTLANIIRWQALDGWRGLESCH